MSSAPPRPARDRCGELHRRPRGHGVLADLGAEVVKVELPDGDPYRRRLSGSGVPESPYDYRWILDNRAKRGVALDLRQAEGRAVLCRLVGRADVSATNTPLDSRARLGIRWEDLAPLNARLIWSRRRSWPMGSGGTAPVFAELPFAAWQEILYRHGLTFGAVAEMADIPADRQKVDSGALVPISDSQAGSARRSRPASRPRSVSTRSRSCARWVRRRADRSGARRRRGGAAEVAT